MAGEGPLAGVTVVTLEQAVSVPMCTRTLADFGARIIKVENPRGGDFARHYDDVVHGLAAHFVWVNRGKESVTLNVKSDAGLGVLHRLLAGADVFVSNLAPGATGRLGLSAADLQVKHPDLIVVDTDGYGSGGPLSHKRAYDLLVQAESGACAVTGSPGMPAKAGPAVADVTTGLYCALSIMSMLYARKGASSAPFTHASVSMFDAMSEMMGYALTYTRHTGVDQVPLGVSSPAVSPYGAFPTSDGQTVVLGTTNDAEWQRLSREMLGRDDLAGDSRFATNSDRVERRAELDEAISGWCAEHTLAHIQTAADAAGIGNSRYNLPSEVLNHPQLKARDRWREIDTPGGTVTAMLPPAVVDGYPARMDPVPGLGQHTDTVLADFGYSAGDIESLRAAGAIGPAYNR